MKKIYVALQKTSRTTIIVTSILFLVLLGISWVTVRYLTRDEVGSIIAHDVQKLAEIFKRIDADCTILSFDYQKNPINFLTIKANGFVGSEVGSMNLAHPGKWKGPYVQENLTVQGKAYQIISTNQGYFIVPGDGVRLPNGKIIGKDIIFDQSIDVYGLMNDENGLRFQGKPLAAPFRVLHKRVEQEIVSEEFV